AHADRDEMLEWLADVKQDPRRVFITHGEQDAAQAFADTLKETRGWETVIPDFGDAFTL
ncbi:MAG: MBL fold metallo-hydrolase, partial [Lentisphaerae bacterium]|nr:MBL fold metallo-hydrolase [Lentisphaerota bacterium]